MKPNILFNKETLFITILFLFSLSINQYYGNQGVFPVDSFSHFDTGFRILLDEHPFKDYWIISGPLVDYFQALFFLYFWHKLAGLYFSCISYQCGNNHCYFLSFKKF